MQESAVPKEKSMSNRNLQAIAYSLLVRWDALGESVRGWGGERWQRVCEKIEDLRDAVNRCMDEESHDVRRMLETKDYDGLADYINRDNRARAREAIERIKRIDSEAS